MAITRKLLGISVALDTMKSDGSVTVSARALVQDSDEGTTQITTKVFNSPAIKQQAEQLRDAIVALAEQAGKPVTF